MSGNVHRSPAAIADLEEIYVYIGEDNLDAAERFDRAAHGALHTLAESPKLGRAYPTHNPRLIGLRVWPISAFSNYLIFYRPLPDGIEVVRVLHGARDIPSVLNDE